MKNTVKTSRVAGQLEKMFRALNARFFRRGVGRGRYYPKENTGRVWAYHLRQDVERGGRTAA